MSSKAIGLRLQQAQKKALFKVPFFVLVCDMF